MSVLEGWKNIIMMLHTKFVGIIFQHVYRECNGEVYLLSNQSLLVSGGFMYYFDLFGSNIILEGQILVLSLWEDMQLSTRKDVSH